MKITKNQKNFCLLEVLFSLYRIYWQKFRSLAKENVPRKGSKTESTRVCNDVQGLPNCAQQQQQHSSTVTQSQMNCETQTQMKDNKQTEIGSKQLEHLVNVWWALTPTELCGKVTLSGLFGAVIHYSDLITFNSKAHEIYIRF